MRVGVRGDGGSAHAFVLKADRHRTDTSLMADRRVRFRSPSMCAMTLLFAVVAACAPPEAAPSAGSPTDWQTEMIVSVNAHRSASGLASLARCGALERAAQAHSEDQAATSTMTHTGSDGSNLRTRVERNGYAGWRGIAENVAAGQPDIATVMDSWMNSPGHRANLLNGSYTHVGVGRASDGNGANYWTQAFGFNGSC